jgi:hypothetical protein
MLKSIAIAALALSVSGAAMAQSSGGSGTSGGGGSMGGGTSAAPGTSGGGPTSLSTSPERSQTAPGSGGRRGPTTAKPALPPGPSAAGQTRRSAGQVDLNRNSATGAANPAITGSGSMERSGAMDRSGSGLPLGPGTGARDNRVPDSSVYNPGIQR